VYDLTGSDCNNLMNNVFYGNFDPLNPSRNSFVNRSNQPHTYAVAFYDSMPGMIGGSFHVQYSIVQPSCGDGYVDQQGEFGTPEQCDDANGAGLDGCTNCMIDAGYQCSGGPSTCYAPLPGDTCSTAQALVTGQYSLSGFQKECSPINCSPDRWLTNTVAQGDIIVVNIVPSQPGTYARLMNMTNSSCDVPPQVVAQGPLQPGQTTTFAWAPSGGPGKVMLELVDQMSDPSNASFSVTVHAGAAGCGDGYLDTAGQYGPPEQCDDGNLIPNDGCSATCMPN
jgi:large repetitive protein